MNKICSRCKRDLPLDCYHKDKNGSFGVVSMCKECRKEYMSEYRKVNKIKLREYDSKRCQMREPLKKLWKTKVVKDNPLQMTYNSIHQYIRRHKNKPKYCVICNEKKKLQLASIGHTYTKDINDYLWACQECHILFDNAYREVILFE